MRLPWNEGREEKNEKIEQLQERIQELEEEKDSFKQRFQAEKERRSELSRKKQDAEKELNRLRDRLRADEGKVEEDESRQNDFTKISYGRVKKMLQKLGTVSSEEKDMVTVYSPGKFENHPRLKDIKNSVNREGYQVLKNRESFVAFIDPDLSSYLVELSPFYSEKLSIDDGFYTGRLLQFIEEEKHWLLVTAGDTRLYREKDGEFEEIDREASRVEKKHSKGGFSQQRFERKREDQIEKHVKAVAEMIKEKDLEEVYILGDKRICSDLPGKYLGNFDPNMKKPEQFYGFQLLQF
ncbi:MAG: Vms1/Ankzf1 family peptidyl-tRNA hydrolase [Candidatus Nanohaloarchaea archaeon]